MSCWLSSLAGASRCEPGTGEEKVMCVNCSVSNPWLQDVTRGEYVCRECGLVAPDHIIDETCERRTFQDDGKNHFRGEMLREGVDNGGFAVVKTHIGQSHTGGRPSKLARAHQALASDANSLIDERITNYNKSLESINAALELEHVIVERAKHILVTYEKRTHEKKGPNSDAAALAALYMACTLLRTGHTIHELLLYVDGNVIGEDDVEHVRKMICAALPEQKCFARVEDVITRQCVLLQLDKRVENRAILMLRAYEEASTTMRGSGHKTSTIAAGLIALACEMMRVPLDRDDVSAVGFVSVGTIDNFCRQMKKYI